MTEVIKKPGTRTQCGKAEVDVASQVRPNLPGGVRLIRDDLLDLRESKDIELVESILSEGESLLVASQKYGFKTVTSCDLAVSLATGTSFLEQFETRRRCSVLYATWETTEAQLRDYFVAIAKSRGVEGKQLREVLRERLHVFPSRQSIRMQESASQREQRMFWQGCAYDVVIIDHCGKAIDHFADSKDSQRRQQGMMAIDNHFGGVGKTAIVHNAHCRKRVTGSLQLTDVAGAGLVEHCRSQLMLRPKGKYVAGKPFVVQMEHSGNGGRQTLFSCEFNEGWGPKGSGYSARVSIDSAQSSDRRQAEARDLVAASVAAFDDRCCKRMSQTQLRKHLKVNNSEVRKLVADSRFLELFRCESLTWHNGREGTEIVKL